VESISPGQNIKQPEIYQANDLVRKMLRHLVLTNNVPDTPVGNQPKFTYVRNPFAPRDRRSANTTQSPLIQCPDLYRLESMTASEPTDDESGHVELLPPEKRIEAPDARPSSTFSTIGNNPDGGSGY
jgi:hypothetical protein